MRVWMVIFFIFSGVIYNAPTVAGQDDLTALCTPDFVGIAVAGMEKAVADAQAAIEAGDAQGAIDLLAEGQALINLTNSTCDGLRYSGSAASVIGPVEIPSGVYRAVVQTAGYIIVEITVIEGTCDEGPIFLMSEGRAAEGAEIVYQSEGCTALIETSNITADSWDLHFEKLN